ncbi:hypothetical protein RNZ50_19465 [Paracoccaceae bacterium Fryx2]|nr:hypothetical protein [Paracoccaceae bacterium Fryx2]
MTADSRNTDQSANRALISDALTEARRNRDLLALATASAANALTALEAILHGSFIPPAEPVSPTAEHRRLHKPGTPSRITADPEIEAFVRARLDRMTFDQIVSAVSEHFTPDRHISRSGLHRWWHRDGKPSDRANRE